MVFRVDGQSKQQCVNIGIATEASPPAALQFGTEDRRSMDAVPTSWAGMMFING
jgi:hypothetical protein